MNVHGQGETDPDVVVSFGWDIREGGDPDQDLQVIDPITFSWSVLLQI